MNIDSKKILPPNIFFTWDIHYACNYNCTYCFLNFEPQTKNIKAIYLKPEQWLKIWKNIFKNYGSCHILVTGGEPFTYPNFIDLISELSKLHTFEFSTNLSFDIEEFIRKVDYTRIKINASFHPEFVEIEEFIDKIKLLKEKNFETSHVVIVAYPPLLNKICKYKERFEIEKIRIIIYPYRGPYLERKFPQDYSDSEKEILKKVGLSWTEKNEKLFDTLVEKKEKNKQKVLCRMGQMYAKIIPDGNVYRCCAAVGKDWGYIGNILKDEFKLYNEPKLCEQLQNCVCFKSMIIGEEERWGKEWPSFLNFAIGNIERVLDLAKRYRNEGKFKEAIFEAKKILEIHPNYINALIFLAEIYISIKEYSLANQFLLKAIEINPYTSYGLRVLANLYFCQNNYDSAIKYFKKAIEWAGEIYDEAQAYFDLARVYQIRGDTSKAIENIDRAIKILPENKSFIEYKNKILNNNINF